jgi:hypothetical protein
MFTDYVSIITNSSAHFIITPPIVHGLPLETHGQELGLVSGVQT